MKKLSLLIAAASIMLAFSSCNSYCVCTASKDGKTIEKYDYSGQDLSRDECFEKVDEEWVRLGETYTSESLVGVSVTCDHL